MACSHAHVFIASYHVLAKGPVFWLPHAPAKIMQGGHFGVLTGVHRKTNPGKPTQESQPRKATGQN